MYCVYLHYDNAESHYQGASETLLGAKQMAGVACKQEFCTAVVVDDLTGIKYSRSENGTWQKLGR